MQRPVVVPRSLLPSVTTRRTLMGLIGSDTRLLIVMWSKLPAERPVSRMSRPVVLLSLVRAPAQPPQHAYFGSRSHTPSSRCLRFDRRVAATPARLAPVLLASAVSADIVWRRGVWHCLSSTLHLSWRCERQALIQKKSP